MEQRRVSDFSKEEKKLIIQMFLTGFLFGSFFGAGCMATVMLLITF